MRYTIILLTIPFLLLNSCQNSALPNDKQSILKQGLLDSMTIELDALVAKSIMPGLSVALVNADSIIYQKGFGYADLNNAKPFTAETINIIASISKTFIGVAVMQLVEAGKLKLEEPINNLLPYDIINPHFPDVPILVKHLVTHTATITDDFDPEDVGEADIMLLEEISYPDAATQAFMDEELAYYKLGKYQSLDENIRRYLVGGEKWYTESNFRTYPPGTKYEYSNLGAELAARIVEVASGIPFDEYTQQNIFMPLQMTHTNWNYDEIKDTALISKLYMPDDWEQPTRAIEHPKYMYFGYPSGDLKTSAHDLSLYLMEMIKGYEGRGALLNQSSYAILFNPQLDETYFESRDTSALNDEYNVGVFWAVSAAGYCLHNGGSMGVYSFLYFNPETNSGALSFSNLPDASFGRVRDIVHTYEQRINAK
ncbi:MAG: beta-lactamase family protein [Chitinophagales bacterium]|nr:beta-lactamase family protein [Chitinophagales bacterium]